MQKLDKDTEQIITERENDWHPAILTVIGLIFVGSGLALFQWVNTISPAAGITNQVSGFSQPNIIDSVGTIIDHRYDKNLVGATVLIEEAQVIGVLGNYFFLVGNDPANAVPVMLLGEATGRQPDTQTVVKTGDTVRIFGILLPLKNLKRISDPEFIRPEEAELLRTKDFYISGIRVDVFKTMNTGAPTH